MPPTILNFRLPLILKLYPSHVRGDHFSRYRLLAYLPPHTFWLGAREVVLVCSFVIPQSPFPGVVTKQIVEEFDRPPGTVTSGKPLRKVFLHWRVSTAHCG